MKLKQLVITPSYVPVDSSTTLINAKIFQRLEEEGVESIILTVDEHDTSYRITPELSEMFALHGPVLRVRSFEKGSRTLLRFREFLHKVFPIIFFTPDYHFIWQWLATIKLFYIKRKYKFDIIHSISAPYCSHLVGLFAKWIFQKPWICHLDDPWVDQPLNHFDVYRLLNRWLERICFRSADSILFTSKEIMQLAQKRYPQSVSDKFSFIPPGFDPEHYPDKYKKNHKKYVLNYLGGFYPGRRDPVTLLRALVRLREMNQSLFKRVQINFIGPEVHAFQALDDKYQLLEAVHFYKPLCYRDAIIKMKEAAVLLHIGGNVGLGKHAEDIYISGKLFEYVGAERLILSLTTKTGPVVDFVKRCNGIVCDYFSPDDIAYNLHHLLTNYKIRDLYAWKNPPHFMDLYNIDMIVSSYNQLLKVLVDG